MWVEWHRPHTLPTPPSQTTTATPIAHGTLHEFFRKARRAFGNTALCLSGGAGMGHYHWGVVQALLHEDLLPNIISGTSAGAVVASFICTRYPPPPNLPFRRVSPCVSCRACAVCRVPCVSLTYDIAGRTNEELKELLTPEGLLPHMNSFSNGWIVRSFICLGVFLC